MADILIDNELFVPYVEDFQVILSNTTNSDNKTKSTNGQEAIARNFIVLAEKIGTKAIQNIFNNNKILV